MPMQPLQRTGRQRRSPNQALRNLAARKYGFPIQTGVRPGTVVQANPVPDPPPDWPGTRPEYSIYWAHGELDLTEGRDFIFLAQTRLLNDPASIQVDFLELASLIAIQVDGLFWHTGLGGFKIESDAETDNRLIASGYVPMHINEHNANEDPVWYLREALAYRSYASLHRGVA